MGPDGEQRQTRGNVALWVGATRARLAWELQQDFLKGETRSQLNRPKAESGRSEEVGREARNPARTHLQVGRKRLREWTRSFSSLLLRHLFSCFSAKTSGEDSWLNIGKVRLSNWDAESHLY